jgi:hypothetical protein
MRGRGEKYRRKIIFFKGLERKKEGREEDEWMKLEEKGEARGEKKMRGGRERER